MKMNKEIAQHYTWGQACDGWHFVKDPNLSVIQEKMPPHTNEVMHYHEKSKQFFFLLKGQAVMIVNENRIEFQSGEGIEIDPGVVHQMRNDSEEEVEFLVISQPHSHQDRHIKTK